ncbi:MAG: HAMP domain-containing histidine kinase [Ruminococcaceae bacterium]|nr:HAMP domain-containing histidine kinase [Oscillospiraceae bacterium]
MFKSIFQRLFWTSTAIIFFVVIVVSASMFAFLNRFVLDEKFSSAEKASKSIEYLTNSMVLNNDDPRAKNMYDTMLSSWSLMVEADIAVINTIGSVFSSTGDRKPPSKDHVQSVLEDNVVRTSATSYKNSREYIIGIPIKYHDAVIGGIFYFFPSSMMQGTIIRFSYMVFLSLLCAMAIAMGLVYFDSRHISGPLKELNTAVLEIASGKYDKHVEIHSRDEIAQLASSFNYMARTLNQTEDMRNSFISDISHELRTPMTSISGFVEGILDGTIPKEKEREYLKIVLDEANRLARLTNEMFEMTKMTSPEYKLSIKELNITETVRLCIISAEHKIDEKNLEIDVWFENDPCMVLADPDAIRRVLINLLENAIKFSNPHTTVGIKVCERNKKICVDIVNHGSGISEEDIPHIFDRFYKSDKSRGRDRAGAGLGLSFVKNILNLHSQQITATSVKEVGEQYKTTFSFTLEKA